jgi:predicted nucleic acid-binding protein
MLARDPNGPPPMRSIDTDDGCLLSLAIDQKAVLVSGGNHVLALAGDFPIYSPAGFPTLIGGPEG